MTARLFIPVLLAVLLTNPLLAQQPNRPPLQRTVASPLGFGSDGAINALPGWDFSGDGKEDLLTLGFTSGGVAEVRVSVGDGAGAFITTLGGGVGSIGMVSLNVTEDTLAAGMLFPAEALGGTARPGVAVIAGGALRLFNTTTGPAQSVGFVSKIGPTISGATLRSVAVSDLNGDGRADIVVTGRVDGGSNPGGVWVILNSAAGLEAPVQLMQPGSEAGKLAVGDVNGDGARDIVVVDTAENCVKVYLASSAGVFSNAPITVEAYGPTPADVRPKAVAVGQILPGGPEEIVMWNDAEADATHQISQFAIFEHTGGNSFGRHAIAEFGLRGVNNVYGDIALGDMNNDGQLDIVGTNPFETGITIWPIALDNNNDVVTTFTPLLYHYSTSNTPDAVAIGNLNGDTGDNSTPKLDLIVTHVGASPNRTVDVFLNAPEPTLPPGTPRITTSQWPILGGELTGTGAPSSTLRYAAIVNGKATAVLPTGQVISSLGEIVGVARNGTYTVTVQVKSGTKFSTKTFSFTVNNVAELTPGAVAWWPGEDAGGDIIGGNTLFSMAEPAYGEGKVGRAFTFDGVDDFLFAPDTTGDLDVRGNITIESWVRPAADSKGIRTIVAKHDSADEDLTFALRLEATGRLSFVTQRATDKKATIVTAVVGTVPNGEWTHVAARVRGVEVTLFINGQVVATKSVPPAFFPPSTLTQAVTVGATCTSPNGDRANFWKGEIDELTIYRRPLDDVEIDLIAKVGEAGKDRYDATRDFSTTAPPQSATALWSYGSMGFITWNPAAFTPFPTLDTTGTALDVWKTGTAGGPEVTRNRLTTPHATSGTTGQLYAPGQVGQKRGSDGSRSIVRWIAPAPGRYAVAATWKCIDFGSIAAVPRVYHGSNMIFQSGTGTNSFLGNGVSFAHTIEVAAAGETVDFTIDQVFADTRDTVSLFASVVEVPEYVPVVTPEPIQVTIDLPLQTGKHWKFRVNQNDSRDHVGRIGIKLQYSATPGVAGSWTDVPEGNFILTGSVGWQLIARNLPVGNFAFRVATTVTGHDTVFGAPTQMFNIEAATTILEFVSHEATVASDPTGATTHRGDTITYRFKVRNAGGLPANDAALRVIIPTGTKVRGKTKGGAIKIQRPIFSTGQTLYYMNWKLGDLVSTPLSEAKTYELVLTVMEPPTKDESFNAPGVKIKQQNYALYEGTFENPTSYVFGPSPTFEHTIVSPLTFTATTIGDPLFARGGLLKMEFTARNSGSIPLLKGVIDVTANNGLVIQRGFSSLTFLDGGAESGVPPLDPKTKKRPTILGVKGNPVLTELSDRRQSALFGIGTLAPGAEQKVRVIFRVPYDWPLDQAITLDSASAYATPLGGRYVRSLFPSVTLTADPAADPAPAKPVLIVTAHQVTAGILEGTDNVGSVTTTVLGVPGSKPKRTSNQITYRIFVGNYGKQVPARFCKAITNLPEGTTFKPKSAFVRTNANITGQQIADPVLQDDQLFFSLPDLDRNGDPDPSVILEFTVTVNKNVAVGDDIKLAGAFGTSREVLEPGFQFEERVARVVQAGRMRYSYTAWPQTYTSSTPFVYHTIYFNNAGGIPRSGVGVKYTIPAGLKFHNAVLTDRPQKHIGAGLFQARPITKPTVGATSGDVVFDIGLVKPGAFGFAQVILTPDAAAVPKSYGGSFNSNFRANAEWSGYDANSNLAALRAPRKYTTFKQQGEGPTEGVISQRFSANNSARPYVILTGPASAIAGNEITYQIGYGNSAHVDEFNSDMLFPIPAGTEYVSATNTTDFGQAVNSPHTYQAPGVLNPYPNGYVAWDGRADAHTFRTANVVVRVLPGTTKIVAGEGARYDCESAGKLFSQTITTHVFPPGTAFDKDARLAVFNAGLGKGGSGFAGDIQRPTNVAVDAYNLVSASSTSVALSGADFAQVDGNGAVVIPIGNGRLVAAGGGNFLSNNGAGLVSENGLGFSIRAGNDATLSVLVPGQGDTTGASLISNAPSLFQSKKIGLFGPGGGIGNMLRPSTLVGNDGASLVGLDGATLVGNDGASLALGVFDIGPDGVKFISTNGGNLTAAIKSANIYIAGSGANLISNIGGALLPPGGIALVGQDGGTLISDNGIGLIGNDSAGLISDNGLGLLSDNGLGLVGNDGASLVGQDGGTLLGNDSATLKTTGGGNFINSGTGMIPSVR